MLEVFEASEKYFKEESSELLISNKPKSTCNMTNIESFAFSFIRYGVEERPTAVIATATLESYSIITPKLEKPKQI